ncbi:LysR substrate-binding domain-containing protein [Oceanospirillum sediminis]|uniref:LysR family transcriptional regulator n=1 Tax=Oceanospirillum sediminis TaxID=2760088 RepID=A0A839IVG2_9GAMM|nr:LysR substrate-binding domain-containing protein [Oceanospirillum sediminis]MBB1488604.1 LysR family transcriptional regulator [Oceanospirillum sediminis]
MQSPPLKAIQYFCIAAQHMSFKEAARQLSVTPGAVSQQVRILESWLGGSLFNRGTRMISLTPLGSTYFNRVNPLLQELIGVTHSMQMLSFSRSLKLSLTQSFSALWLNSNLKEFIQQHPLIDLRIHTSSYLINFADDGSELAIRYLAAPDPSLSCYLLQSLRLFPVCSMDYLEQFPGIRQGDFSDCTLIHDILHPDWHRFYPEMQLDNFNLRALHFDQAQLALSCAENGLGITLADQILARDALAKQRLVRVGTHSLPAHRHLYLAYSARAPLSPQAELLKNWLLLKLAEV